MQTDSIQTNLSFPKIEKDYFSANNFSINDQQNHLKQDLNNEYIDDDCSFEEKNSYNYNIKNNENYLKKINELNSQIENISTQKNQIKQKMTEYVSEYKKVDKSDNWENDSYYVHQLKLFESLESQEYKINYEKEIVNGLLDDNEIIENNNSPELNKIQTKLNDIYIKKFQLNLQYLDYAPKYNSEKKEFENIENIENDAYYVYLIKMLETFNAQKYKINYKKNNNI